MSAIRAVLTARIALKCRREKGREARTTGLCGFGSSDMVAAWVWLLRSEYAGEASCAAGVTCRSGVPRRAGWRQPGDRHDVTSLRSRPSRCDIVAVAAPSPGADTAR